MRRFFCDCGQEIFLENQLCVQCGSVVAYLPESGTMVSLTERNSHWQLNNGQVLKLCSNRSVYNVCNAALALGDANDECCACRLNRTIPDLSKVGNLEAWAILEQAKRRLLFGLLSLGLPLQAPLQAYPRGLCFDFLEDQRTNPAVSDEFVATGHYEGVITINLLEADEVQRTWQREQSSERYRTVLGHMRHEVGHYYFELLVPYLDEFITLFGDPNLPYDDALQRYYQQGPLAGWEQRYISAYASAHPIEDWAESFAHYLHMRDTLETAMQRAVIPALDVNAPIDQWLHAWDGLTVTLNELNRGLGLSDAYPFVVTPIVAEKLRLIHRLIASNAMH